MIWALILGVGQRRQPHRREIREGFQYSGATFYIFVYMLVVAVQIISITFPFALGYGVTRRDFYLGSALTFVMLAAAYSVALTVLSMIEDATGGWGLGGKMFTATYFGENPAERLLIFFLGFLFFFFAGAPAAAIWVRWKVTGLATFLIGIGIILVGACRADDRDRQRASGRRILRNGRAGRLAPVEPGHHGARRDNGVLHPAQGHTDQLRLTTCAGPASWSRCPASGRT